MSRIPALGGQLNAALATTVPVENQYVGGLDDIDVKNPDILVPRTDFHIRPLTELWFEESLPASLYQYFTGNTKEKQAIEARKKIKELEPGSDEWKEQLRIFNKYSYLIPEEEGGNGGDFDITELAKFVASHPTLFVGELFNAVLADPYLAFIPWLGWGKLGANVHKALGITSKTGQKVANAAGMFGTGAAFSTVYGGAYQLSEDEELSAGRTLAEATIGGTLNLAIGGAIAGLATKTVQATGADSSVIVPKIMNAVEQNPADPIPAIKKTLDDILDDMDAPDLTKEEVSKLVQYRLAEEIENAKQVGSYNVRAAVSLGGIGALSGFLTAKEDKILSAATTGIGVGLIPIGFKAATRAMFGKKKYDIDPVKRTTELNTDEFTSALDGNIEGINQSAQRLQNAIKENFSAIKREAFVFATEHPERVVKYVDFNPKIKTFKWDGDVSKGGWARYNRKSNTVFIDEDVLIQRFNDKAWTKPKVEGVKPLSESQFKTIDEWRKFVIGHEKAHAAFPRIAGESLAAYENRMNAISLARPKTGDYIFTWKKHDRELLLNALIARNKHGDAEAKRILDGREEITIAFNKKDKHFLDNELRPYLNNVYRKMQDNLDSRFGYIANYITHEWEEGPIKAFSKLETAKKIDQGMTLQNGTSVAEIIGATGKTSRTKNRLIASVEEGIELGFMPRSNDLGELDIADILMRQAMSVGKATTEQRMINFLKGKYGKTEGTLPVIVESLAIVPKDMVPDYVPYPHPILNKKTYSKRFNELTGKDEIVLAKEEIAYVHKAAKPYIQMVMDATDPGAVMKHATGLNFFMKRWAVGASFFHVASLGESQILTFLTNPGKNFINWRMSGNILKDTATGRKNKMIEWMENPDAPSFKKWMEEQFPDTVTALEQSSARDVMQLLVKNGLMLSKPADVGHDSFYATFNKIERIVASAPFMGKVLNDLGVRPMRKVFRWFDKVTWERGFTSMKLYAGIAHLNQGIMKNPNVPLRILARDSAKFANDAFGGQSMVRSANDIVNPMIRRMAQETLKPGSKPYLQLALFAPDWTFSNINILAKGFRAFNSNERTRMLYMSYLINGAILMAILGNALQYAFTGKSILENKDPTRIDLGNGEVITFSKQFMEPFHWITDPQKTLLKKTGSLAKTSAEVLSNKQYLTTGWSPQITKKDDAAIIKAAKLGEQVGKKFLPIWINKAIEDIQKDGLTWDDALNVVMGQLGHPIYKGPRTTSFQTRQLVEDPMKALF